jgi:competence protein ComEC
MALWLPVMLGLGIGLWFALPTRGAWLAVITGGAGLALLGLAVGPGQRTGRALIFSGLAIATGCGLVWVRSERVGEVAITRPMVVTFAARVVRIEHRPAQQSQRLLLDADPGAAVPPRLRVSVDLDKQIAALTKGDRIVVRARLVPPPNAAVPGGYDFERAAWFQRIGATGKVIAPLERIGAEPVRKPGLRQRLSSHIQSRIDGSAGGIAAAFATGDRGAIAEEDEEAMRASGLTHLLSVSGLHITAVVGAAFFVTLRLLALVPFIALRWPLMLIAAAIGAAAGIGYTLLTGAEVPTIRSCLAALLVLAALALGREAITLRSVATGALIVLCLWPEALVGASFQLSFAAITALVAFHDHPSIRAFALGKDDGAAWRMGRSALLLLATGVVVELALAPIALYHFHKSGLYGALANMIAIPLTTFVIMPLEAIALLLDLGGLGGPFWWLTGQGMGVLLWLARAVAAVPGAVATLPSIPAPAFGLMLAGGLWLLLWRRRPRWLGLPMLAAGTSWALLHPAPDLLITGDGRHLAVRGDDGRVGLLRDRAGDYVRDLLAERAGQIEPLETMESLPGTRCGRDLCLVTLRRGGRTWTIAATRTADRLPWRPFVRTCAAVDIIVSDRRLPDGCRPLWLKADRVTLKRSGGLSISLDPARIDTVRLPRDDHPWVPKKGIVPPNRTADQ